MKIKAIEPTPSPNTMKITLSEALPSGTSHNYNKEHLDRAPAYIKELLEMEGVKGVYHVADFLALERNPRFDWKVILPQARAVFGEGDGNSESEPEQVPEEESFGEVKVYVQKFRNIPMQVKLHDGSEERRFGLPERFQKAVMETQQVATNVVVERQWVEYGARYGDLNEIGEQIVEELSAAYDEERLSSLVHQVINPESVVISKEKKKVTTEMLDAPDWKDRYAALEQMDPEEKDIPVLAKALQDPKASIRRLGTVYLGMIENPVVLPYLYGALKDSSVTVRRTAGDCLSDIGSEAAIPEMIQALKDPNKLVRWRAAMFLYEVGDEQALPALQEAVFDKEFEVAMQAKMALKRIEGGQTAEGSVWKQMTESLSKDKNNS